MQFIPPELQRAIAVYCDRQTLGRLSAVDRIWNAECLPVLFASIILRVGERYVGKNSPIYSSLVHSPDAAAHVRAVLIEHCDEETITGVDALTEVLLHLPNLGDLRLRHTHDGDDDHRFVRALLERLYQAGARCPFRLHTLHLSDDALSTLFSYRSWDRDSTPFGSPLEAFLHPHAASLRVLGVFSRRDPRRLQSPISPRAHGNLPTGCMFFGYCFLRAPTTSLAVALGPCTRADAAAVVRSLADDPWPSVSCATVEWLQIYVGQEPDAAVTALFPRTRTLWLPVQPVIALDIEAIACAASPLPDLVALQLRARGLPEDTREVLRVSVSTLKDVARRVFAAGCVALSEIDFPDGSSKLHLLRPPQDGVEWYVYESPDD
ncbi:hypothetical protein AURDEDRAFT_172186 [Auricularia subglabra TFB-10046 SS5]|nr:hypothetical protein AURDEDRAFT_172186 [Auricularia subglabra TFB-10046 SS5]